VSLVTDLGRSKSASSFIAVVQAMKASYCMRLAAVRGCLLRTFDVKLSPTDVGGVVKP
jgi:hypothetical protein